MVNLDTATSYSLLQSTIKIEDLIEYAKKHKLNTLAIADINVMYGAIKFFMLCKKNGIKPIIGLNIQIKDLRIIAYAKNNNGYLNLVKISSMINTDKINVEQIKSLLNDDVVTIGNPEEANYSYKELGLSKVRYMNSQDFLAYDVIKAIKKQEVIDLEKVVDSKFSFEEAISKPSNKLVEEIVKDIDLNLLAHKSTLPKFDIPNNGDSGKYLEYLCLTGLGKRFGDVIDQKYLDRLKIELEVISKMGYQNYFLIVWDFISFAKKSGIRVGPGRGSAAGSLIAYALDITNVDPIKYNLLFERFLNPERVSMPDIDIDFMDTRREEVIEYIVKKYGQDHAALIITFQTIAARSSIRDVARTLDVPLSEADKIAKAIPSAPGTKLADALKTKKFKVIIESKEIYKKLISIAQAIEGIPRNYSTHAAGIVLADKNLHNYVPTQTGYSGIETTQYSMKYLEDLGLLKIDILGLRNLTTISQIVDLIKERTGKTLKVSKIPLDDKRTNSSLQNGLTTGIFQLESPGMKGVLKKMKANSLEDIVSASSLYRPGPQENIPSFIARKFGIEKIEYPSPVLEDILKSTYGIIVYQEQIMQIAQVFAGFSLAKADILRRAMGKKDAQQLKSMEAEFFAGAEKNGHDKKVIKEVYDLIFKFAEYGFNRSHAVAYSIIGYQMLYLKANFPQEFLSCLLTSVIGSKDKMSMYMDEAKSYDIEILPPSINVATDQFKIVGKNIMMPITSINKVGRSLYSEIEELLKESKFKDIYDFFGRANTRKISTSAIELLIKSGALDEFGYSRTALLKSTNDLITWADACVMKKDGKKVFDPELLPQVGITDIKDNNEGYGKFEVEAFGYYVKFNPLSSSKLSNVDKIASAISKGNNANVRIYGILKSVRKFRTKWGKDMAFATLDDGSNKLDCMISPSHFGTLSNVLVPNSPVVVEGVLAITSKTQLKVTNVILHNML